MGSTNTNTIEPLPRKATRRRTKQGVQLSVELNSLIAEEPKKRRTKRKNNTNPKPKTQPIYNTVEPIYNTVEPFYNTVEPDKRSNNLFNFKSHIYEVPVVRNTEINTVKI